MAYKQYDPTKMPKDQSLYSSVQYWATKGLSKPSIAIKCGFKTNDFLLYMAQDENLQYAWETGRAMYEEVAVEARNQILADTQENSALRAKIAYEQLRAFEDHAPASRALKLVHEATGVQLDFMSLTENEQEQIQAAVRKDDNDAEEDSASED